METVPINIISDTKTTTSHLKLKRNINPHLTCSVFSMYSNAPSNPQVHAAHGRCAECPSVWPFPDFAGLDVLYCFFCSYGTVFDLLCVVTS